MLKRLRENQKSKKGFTLVELIVVIVIILVLAAVMVPSVLRYVDKANKANTKSDAATILVDVQAKIADIYSEETVTPPEKLESNGVEVERSKTLKADKGDKEATFDETDGELESFSYCDTKHWIQWTKGGGWTDVDPKPSKE